MLKTKERPKGPQSLQDRFRAISASVDWITLTASSHGCGEGLYAKGNALLREHERIGDRPVPWQMKGYRGWAAVGVRLGSRATGAILSMSGPECSENWRDSLVAAENCSRLDLAVDVNCDPIVPHLASHIYKELGHRRLRAGRPVTARLIMGSDGGSTVYIGSRASERFGRLYDKGVEQQTNPPGHWWRWELELKGKAAQREAIALVNAESEPDRALHVVAEYFEARTGYAPAQCGPLVKCLERREPTSTAKKLLWLSSQVRPTVQELIGIVGPARVLETLGLRQSAVSSCEQTLTGADYASSSR